MKIYLDDTRFPPDDSWDKTPKNSREFLQDVFDNCMNLTWVSFDNDLADFIYTEDGDVLRVGIVKPTNEITGYMLMAWFIDTCLLLRRELPIITIHSANNVACDQMEGLLKEYQARGLLNPAQQDNMFKCFYLDEMMQQYAGKPKTYYCVEEETRDSWSGPSYGVRFYLKQDDANKAYLAWYNKDFSGRVPEEYTIIHKPFELITHIEYKDRQFVSRQSFKDKHEKSYLRN